ncbi:TagK domain-containing protein [Paraburkholderia sp. BCC1886]|uniref:TagK domain-containing protein n=1 Tax=Paraburkholderia sp. BCC1886 TaxID=2562670 RepID=UPI0011825321|nr:TagK domain-containing protein [Paraburkholderia sp. BCC1886]
MTPILYFLAAIVIGLFKKNSDYPKINCLIFKTQIGSFTKKYLAARRLNETHTESISNGTSFPPSNIVAQDLIAALRGQYFQALYDPQMRPDVDLSAYVAPPPASVDPSRDRPRQHEWRVRDSIEALLSKPGSIDAEFGLVRIDNLPDPEQTVVPEILRVFAPNGPIDAQEPARRPPELVLREHHAVSLDTPLRCPRFTEATGNRHPGTSLSTRPSRPDHVSSLHFLEAFTPGLEAPGEEK